jgi:uncharacterized membrane protein
MANCAKCGSELLPGAAFCGACGATVAAAAPPPAAPAGAPSTPSAAGSGGLPSNVAGALAYFTIIPAIIFLVVEPFNKDRFVKFHAFQCLFLAAAMFVFGVLYLIVSVVVNFIPVVGTIIGIIMWILIVVIQLGLLALVIFLMYQAYNEKKFKLPFIGNLAEQQAEK